MYINFTQDRKSLGYKSLKDSKCDMTLKLLSDYSVTRPKIFSTKNYIKGCKFAIALGIKIGISTLKPEEVINSIDCHSFVGPLVVSVYKNVENKPIDFKQLNSEQNESSNSLIKINDTIVTSNTEIGKNSISKQSVRSKYEIEEVIVSLQGGTDEDINYLLKCLKVLASILDPINKVPKAEGFVPVSRPNYVEKSDFSSPRRPSHNENVPFASLPNERLKTGNSRKSSHTKRETTRKQGQHQKNSANIKTKRSVGSVTSVSDKLSKQQRRNLPDPRDGFIKVEGRPQLNVRYGQVKYKTPAHGKAHGLPVNDNRKTPKTDQNALRLRNSLLKMPDREDIKWFENGGYQKGTSRGYDSLNIYDKRSRVIAVYKKNANGEYDFATTCKLTPAEEAHLYTSNGNFVTERVLNNQKALTIRGTNKNDV